MKKKKKNPKKTSTAFDEPKKIFYANTDPVGTFEFSAMRMHFYLPRSVLRPLFPDFSISRETTLRREKEKKSEREREREREEREEEEREKKRETENSHPKNPFLFFFQNQKPKSTSQQLKSLLESKFRTIDDFRVETERREAEAAAAAASAKEAKAKE